jgi:hypothetical protein
MGAEGVGGNARGPVGLFWASLFVDRCIVSFSLTKADVVYPIWPFIGAIDEANISATHTLFRVTTHSSSQSSSVFYCSARASRTSSGLAALVKRDCSWLMLFE